MQHKIKVAAVKNPFRIWFFTIFLINRNFPLDFNSFSHFCFSSKNFSELFFFFLSDQLRHSIDVNDTGRKTRLVRSTIQHWMKLRFSCMRFFRLPLFSMSPFLRRFCWFFFAAAASFSFPRVLLSSSTTSAVYMLSSAGGRCHTNTRIYAQRQHKLDSFHQMLDSALTGSEGENCNFFRFFSHLSWAPFALHGKKEFFGLTFFLLLLFVVYVYFILRHVALPLSSSLVAVTREQHPLLMQIENICFIFLCVFISILVVRFHSLKFLFYNQQNILMWYFIFHSFCESWNFGYKKNMLSTWVKWDLDIDDIIDGMRKKDTNEISSALFPSSSSSCLSLIPIRICR